MFKLDPTVKLMKPKWLYLCMTQHADILEKRKLLLCLNNLDFFFRNLLVRQKTRQQF